MPDRDPWPGRWIAGDRLSRRASERGQRPSPADEPTHAHRGGRAPGYTLTVSTIADADRLQVAVAAGEGEWLASDTWEQVRR